MTDNRTPNHFPTDYDARKAIPIMTGVLDYFPDAIAAVAEVSVIGNNQHNPGEPLHWARGKSTDQLNTAVRHLIQRGGRDTDGGRHLAKAAWRVLAALQEEIEAEHVDVAQPDFPVYVSPKRCEHGRQVKQDVASRRRCRRD